MTAVALVDYGAGNLTSVVKGLEAAGAEVRIAAEASALAGAAAIVVPGVGHFAQTARLGDDWRAAVREALAAGVPLLGICLGMQWLFEGSEEAPALPGLGVFTGRVTRLPSEDDEGRRLKVPHLGWNLLERTNAASTLLAGVPPPVYGYFAHGYAAPVAAEAVAVSAHGRAFAAIVERAGVFGIQCHPEKSGRAGLALLRNFIGVVERREAASEARSC